MIRAMVKTDFDFIYSLYMDPRVNPFLFYEYMDRVSFLPIFTSLVDQQIKFVYYSETKETGMFKLIPLQHRNHHIVYLGGLAIAPAFSGKGHGHKMLSEIILLAAERGFLRIELSVSVANLKAIQLYEKVGFQKEGVLRKFTHLESEDRFIDEVVMSFIF